jgi:deazaflavin-dependent oxidoreductase (nitroreductase family)
MAKTYHLNPMRRFINRMMRTMIRLGIGPQQTYLLTVRGRKSGKPMSTPVSLVEDGSTRWIVAPYGNVNWVKNARAAGEVQLTRRGKTETVKILEVGASESAPVLKKYIQMEAITRPYFTATVESSVEEFAREADQHPVFRVR